MPPGRPLLWTRNLRNTTTRWGVFLWQIRFHLALQRVEFNARSAAFESTLMVLHYCSFLASLIWVVGA